MRRGKASPGNRRLAGLTAAALLGAFLAAGALCSREAFVRGRVGCGLSRLTGRAGPRYAQHSSSYRGVSWHDGWQQWQVHIADPVTEELVSLGLFLSERDAAKAYDCAMLSLKGSSLSEPSNFPSESYTPEDIAVQSKSMRDYYRPRPSSRFYGVYQTRGSDKWKAEIEIDGKQFINFFDDEVVAAHATDTAVRGTAADKATKLEILNFREESDYFDDDWEEERVPRGASSRFIGVSYHQPSGQFLAKIRRRNLGLFDEEDEAARAFDEAALAKGRATNFKPSEKLRV